MKSALSALFVTVMTRITTKIFIIASLLASNIYGQNVDDDAFMIKKIYDHTLNEGMCYTWLDHLSTNIGGRLAGSRNASTAVDYTKSIMMKMSLDDVKLQECTVPHWVRGNKEIVEIVKSKSLGTKKLNAIALGNSIGTGAQGLTSEVIEVQGLDEVRALGRSRVEGKIVFYNRPMDPTQIRTFYAYGGAVDQRGSGPSVAAEYGATAAIVRSMTTRLDDVPHTGVTVYNPAVEKIPALAVSTNDAEMLSDLLDKEKVNLYIENTSTMLDSALSYNVIGEIKGSTYPEEIIVVGGHLDSWDVGGGAHDDGAGCVHALQVLQTIKDLGYQPQRTIRCVMFMNEENGLAGGKEYAKVSNEKGEFHLAAIESDAGGFTPRGFGFSAVESVFKGYYDKVLTWQNLLEPYGIQFSVGGGGADINPLKSQEGMLIGLRPDSQRYFDYHHTATDVIDVVNQRELELGAAAMTSLVYLIDKYGLK